MTSTIKGTYYLTVEEGAERLATTTMRVLMLIREKTLTAVHLEGEWLVTADSVAGCPAAGLATKTAAGCARSCASAGGCACKS